MKNYNIDTITSKLNTRVIVFEGPDCSGKTTLLNSLSYAMSAINGGLYSFVDTFKFPQYFSDIGPYILEYLKAGPDEIIKDSEKMDEFSKLQTINKIAALDKFINTAKNTDCIFIDRFIISQLAYDFALLDYAKFHKKKINKTDKSIRIERAELVNDIYSRVIQNMITVYCSPSRYIKGVSKYFRDKLKKEGRRFDPVDDNAIYQNLVRKSFDNIINTKDDFNKFDLKKYTDSAYIINTDEIMKEIYLSRNRLKLYTDITLCQFDNIMWYEDIIQDVKKEFVNRVKNDLTNFISSNSKYSRSK